MSGRKCLGTVNRDGVFAQIFLAGHDNVELVVVDANTGANIGALRIPQSAVGAVIYTLQAFYDDIEEEPADPAPVEPTEKKSAPKKRAAKNRKTTK